MAVSALSGVSMVDAADTKRANKWMIEFERSRDAWSVADQMIREPTGSPCIFFGAKILYSKLKRDFKDFNGSPDAVNGITNSLVEHIIRLAQDANSNFVVIRYLCLSLAVLALQINKNGIVQEILGWLNPIIMTAPRVVLELITVLPEECFNRQVDVNQDTRLALAHQMATSINDVFGFLSYLSTNDTIVTQIGNDLLNCLEKWIYFVDIPATSLGTQPVYAYAMNCLTTGNNFEAAVEVAITVLRRYGCTASDMHLVTSLMPYVVALRNVWNTQILQLNEDSDDDDMNICRCIARLYTELSEACIEIYEVDADVGQNEILMQLIECAKFPYDINICCIPLQFFYQFSCYLVRKRLLLPRYQDFFKLATRAGLIQITPSEDYIIGRSKLSDDEMNKRYEWIETFRDCVDLLEPMVFIELVCGELQRLCTQAPKWNDIEACLFALHIVIPYLANNESMYLPQIMTLIASIPENMPGIQKTLIELVGSCAHWLNANPVYVRPLLNKLFNNLQSQEYSSAAAIAIMKVLKRCCRVPELPVQDLIILMAQLRGTGSLALEADLYLTEGLCYVISNYPPDRHSDALLEVIDPIYKSITASLDETVVSSDRSGNVISANIDKLTCIMRYIDVDRSLIASIFGSIQPALERAVEVYRLEKVCEKVCRCYKHTIKNCRASFLPYLPAMAAHLTARFQQIPYSAFLYAASTCISQFASCDHGAHVEVLSQMLISMSEVFFQTFGFSLSQFEQSPDVVEEYFYMMAKALQQCPNFLMLPDVGIGNTLVRAGVIGLGLNHKEAQKGILSFFEELIRLQLRPDLHSTPLQQVVYDLVLQVGGPLIQTVLQALSGQLPVYAIEEKGGSIHDLLWNLRKLPDNHLQLWLVAAYNSSLPWVQEEISKSNLMERLLSHDLTAPNAHDDFGRILENFISRCHRE